MNFKNVQNYQELHDFNYVTFLNKDSIDIKLKSFFKKRRFKKIQKYINNYLHEDTNISVVLVNRKERQEIKNDKKYFFDENKEPQTNMLYYKLNTGNGLHEYFTYEKYLIKKEEYNIGLIKRLTSRLGLQKIEVDQKTKNILVSKYGTDSKIILNIEKLDLINLGLNKNKELENKNERTINSVNTLENHGCELFFKSFRYRDVWCEKFYQKNLIPVDEVVKIILSEQNYFSLESYELNRDLGNIIDQRLSGLDKLIFNLTENEYESLINKKFIKLDTKIRKFFGIEISSESNSTNIKDKYINKTLEIYFHHIRKLEVHTVIREIKRLKTKINTELVREDVNFQIVKDKIKEISEQLDILKSGLERCKELDTDNTDENKYKYSDTLKDIEELFQKINKAKKNKTDILTRRMGQVIEELGKVPHNGYWCNGRSENRCPYWTCCKSNEYYSSCINKRKQNFRNMPRSDYQLNSTSTSTSTYPLNKPKKYSLAEVAELAIDEFGNSAKHPGCVFESTYVNGYNPNNDTIQEGYYMVKRVR